MQFSFFTELRHHVSFFTEFRHHVSLNFFNLQQNESLQLFLE